MTRTVERTFPRTPRELVEGMLSPEYQALRGERLGGTAPSTVTRDGDTATVTFPRKLPMDSLPGPLRSLAGTGDVTQHERWTAIGDDRCAGEWETEASMPGKVRGTYEVVAAGEGSATFRVVATAKVNVPLIGGRIAGEVEGHVVRLIEAEMDLAEQWLREQ
ncbi:MAG TPA: DUF2505 domain-containing protein [Mycobacteriales bacterium]|nr:DUF2505 domain-containing protein [Mycobacteriales bacterium]